MTKPSGRSMGEPPPRVARAFAPGHVTGIFRPDERSRDPRGRGSVGAGVVLELGVHVEARFSPGARTRLRLIGDGSGPWPITEDVARRLAPSEPGSLTVLLRHELPIGQGFGMSAAGALATALAVGQLSSVPKDRAAAVAHLADLFGGGGLGGVPAILGGGLELRTRPGLPPLGRVVRRRFDCPLWIGVVGDPMPSPSILRDPRSLARIAQASRGLEKLERRLEPNAFFQLSERFTDRVGLASPEVKRVVGALRRSGVYAAQAMFGQSFFAFPRSPRGRARGLEWLRRNGVPTVEVHASAVGARRLPAPSSRAALPAGRSRRRPQSF